MHCDVLIAGAGAGGTAAALAARRLGLRVVLVEAGSWAGGQLTSQGVCTPDENRWIESCGATQSYLAFRHAVRAHYRKHCALAPDAAASDALNPGACWVSKLSYEPAVGAAALEAMLSACGDELTQLWNSRVTSCQMDDSGTRIDAVWVETPAGRRSFQASWVLDATDTGELLPMCGAPGADWLWGAEPFTETGEPDAPTAARPDWVQPFTFPFGVEWSPSTQGENVIEPPHDYVELKAEQNYSVCQGAITGLFSGAYPWWTYRRIIAASCFSDPRYPADIAMINTPGNDYDGGGLLIDPNVRDDERAACLARGRRASLGYLYWLQTECPREEGGFGYPEMRLARGLFATEDGCARDPYIRESRRIRSMRPILQQEIVAADFSGRPCQPGPRAALMPDSVGTGHYALDIHPNHHGEVNHYVATRPFQIPLSALIPVRLVNYLPACKNLGVTHLTNGAYRLHPIEWNIGESAAHLAAFCLAKSSRAWDIAADPLARVELQERLLEDGIPLSWVVDVRFEHPCFAAVQRLALTGADFGRPDLEFRPDEPLDDETWADWCKAAGKALDERPQTRGGGAIALCGA